MFQLLIVDDTKSVHNFIKNMLLKVKNIEVTDCYNGEEALQLLTKNSSFDLILLDWEMPKKNGPDTLKEIVKSGITIPVLMMTTKNSAEDILSMLESGASEYMMKPFTIDILIEKMEYASRKSLVYAA